MALSRDRLAWGFRGLSYASPGRRISSELDLLVGGRDRWTGYPRHRGTLFVEHHGVRSWSGQRSQADLASLALCVSGTSSPLRSAAALPVLLTVLALEPVFLILAVGHSDTIEGLGLSQSIFGKTRRPPGTEVLRSILAPLVGIHRQFIARCYHRGCPAVAPQCFHSACTTKLHYGRRVYLADPQAPSSGRRKIEAALEASLGSPEMHVGSSCAGRATMFRLHRGGRPPSHEPGTWRGKKSLTFEVNTALRFHSTHQATVPAIGGRMFLSLLHI